MSRRVPLCAVCGLIFSLLAWAPAAAGEELALKDGKKIVGTIVGYEDDMFRVETEFGFALVRKDRVATINLIPPVARKSVEKREALKKSPLPEPAAPVEQPALPNPPGPGERAAAPTNLPSAASVPPAVVPSAVPVRPEPKPAPPPPPVSRPLDEPLPTDLKEHLEGTTYVNDTFQFAMYKPPGWRIFEGASKETGRAIVALGTEDERTLLIVDRQVWSGAPDLNSNVSESKLREGYQNYRKLSESPAEIDGRPALRRVFTGEMDNAEWHGVSIHVARGNLVFGIIGLTSSETLDFHRAVLDKIINSFRFLSTSPTAGASPSKGPTL